MAGGGAAPVARASGSVVASTSSVLTVLTLLKTMMGAGIFTLPIGLWLATPIPGLAFLGTICVMSASAFWMVGYCCLVWEVDTFRGVWHKALGVDTAWVIDVIICTNGFFTLLGYLVLIGDFTTKSLGGLLGEDHPLALYRRFDVCVVSLFVLLPLSLARDLRRLAFTSSLGLVVVVYVVFLVLRDFWLHAPAELGPDVVLFEPRIGAFKAIALYTHAFVAHYSAPKLYSEFRRPTSLRWLRVVLVAYLLAFVVYSSFAIAGFRRFEGAVLGNILRNYQSELSVLIAWLGMGFSIAFTYPVVFNSTREALLHLMSPEVATRSYTLTSIVLLVGTVVVASMFTDVSVVNAIAGSILGCNVAYICPALLFFHTLKAQLAAATGKKDPQEPLLPGQPLSKFAQRARDTPRANLVAGLLLARMVMIAGCFFAVLGLTVAITGGAS